MQQVLDFERGMEDFKRGLIRCPFKRIDRAEFWIDGWKTAQLNA